jgi:predicted site-specific integrase-resolvase
MELLTRAEVKNILKISESTVIRWEKKGILKPIKIDKKVLYELADVEELINDSKKSNG